MFICKNKLGLTHMIITTFHQQEDLARILSVYEVLEEFHYGVSDEDFSKK